MVNENWYREVRGKDEVEGWFLGVMKEHVPVYSILDNMASKNMESMLSLSQELKATAEKMT